MGWTLEQLSERASVDVGTINALENRDSKRSMYASNLARAFGLTTEALERGEFDPDPASAEPSPTATGETADVVTVRVFEAGASMGHGRIQADHDTVVDHIRLTRQWVRSHLPSISSANSLAVLSAYGDSMSPTFSDGDILLVDRDVQDIKIDAVYVLSLNGELYVKRIQRRITDGAVIIKSDNPLYDPVVVDNGDRARLSVLGRVVWAWNGRKL
ncbi:MAG: hypothetical protein PWP11_870 [Thauera sp.]|nr:hypothetical protein [Thauera sp.]